MIFNFDRGVHEQQHDSRADLNPKQQNSDNYSAKDEKSKNNDDKPKGCGHWSRKGNVSYLKSNKKHFSYLLIFLVFLSDQVECECTDDDGKTCIFPFVNEGDIHYSCAGGAVSMTGDGGSNFGWCATSIDPVTKQLVHGSNCSSNCVCNSQNEFTCPDGSCVTTDAICDGMHDCPDSADEFCESLGRLISGTTMMPYHVEMSRSTNIDCQIPVIGSSGVIESPNFPQKYEPNYECDWIIIADDGMFIQLNFTSFKVRCPDETEYDDDMDNVEIRLSDHNEMGVTGEDLIIEKYSCYNPPNGNIHSTLPDKQSNILKIRDNVAIIRFHTTKPNKSDSMNDAPSSEADELVNKTTDDNDKIQQPTPTLFSMKFFKQNLMPFYSGKATNLNSLEQDENNSNAENENNESSVEWGFRIEWHVTYVT